MIQQNDVLHWQCSEDAPFMLQLLFNHLHLEHLSSVSLYGTQDLHRAFLTLSDSQFLLLTSHPKTPQPPSLFTFFPLSSSLQFEVFLFVSFHLVSRSMLHNCSHCFGLVSGCAQPFSVIFIQYYSSLSAFIPALSSNSPFVTWSC